MDRVILHSDLNNFYASVECILNPLLCGKCIAVCGSEENRHGIVLAKSEEAKSRGVKTAETIWQAKSKCPNLVVVSPHFEQYHKYSVMVRNIYKRYTDLVEPFGLDECWLDVTGSRMLFGDGMTIAESIRNAVRKETGLTVSVGVSFNKVFAKLGSDLKKPDAVTEISKADFKEKIWHLDADTMLGVGKSTYTQLCKLGIRTIGDIAMSPSAFFESRFGKHGKSMWQYANGLDDSPVMHQDYRAPVKSVGHGMTLKEDLTSNEEVWRIIYHLCRMVEAELRRKDIMALTCALAVKNTELKTKEFQTPMQSPTQSAYSMAKSLFALFRQKYIWDKNIRAITVRAVKLCDEDNEFQLSIFDAEEKNEKRELAEKTAYELETRFGKGSITFGSLMNNEKIPSKPE